MRSDGRVVGSGEVLAGLHVDDIGDILADAMAQRVIAAQQTLLVGNLLEVLVEHLLRVDDRTYLEQIQLTRLVVTQIAGELNLHGTLHGVGAKLLRHLQELGQREDALLQDAAEGDNLAATLVDAVADDLVDGIEG